MQILIFGQGYIGKKFAAYWQEKMGQSAVCISARHSNWEKMDFSVFDAVVNASGLAHQKETAKNRADYFRINRDLAMAVAKKAMQENVSRYVYFSSMSVYGKTTGAIFEKTPLSPKTAYGQSKLEGEEGIFHICGNQAIVFRPPMVYGDGCKGNFPKLVGLVKRLPFWPAISNRRSMVNIDILCQWVAQTLLQGETGLFFPANGEDIDVFYLAKEICRWENRPFRPTKVFNPLIRLLSKRPGRFQKIFADLYYEESLKKPPFSLEKEIRFSDSVGKSFDKSIYKI